MATPARTNTGLLAGAILAGAAISFIGALFFPGSHSSLGPALFAVPLAVALVHLGHLRWFGGVYLALTVAAAYIAAIYVSIQTYGWLGVSLCLFQCTPQEIAANVVKNQAVGAVGGAVGSLIPFLAIMLLGPALRTRSALITMFIAVIVLAFVGAIGMSKSLPFFNVRFYNPDAPTPQWVELLLYIAPWQLIFGATLALLLTRHTPRVKAPAAPVAQPAR